MNTSLNKKLEEVEWGKFRLIDLFGKSTRGKRLKSANRVPGDLPFVTAGEANQGVSAFIGNDVRVFERNTVTIDMFGSAKYRNYRYGADDHVAIVHTEKLSDNSVKFICSAIEASSHNGQFDYSRNFYAKDADELEIFLPVDSNGQINFVLMEKFVAELEAAHLAELEAYLQAAGLNDYKLSAEEEYALDRYHTLSVDDWKNMSLGSLFDQIAQGRRLKKDDQIEGSLPFVMAGMTNTGVVRYISNEVRVFPRNSITVDIFGNVFYRSYEFGAGDDTGVYWSSDSLYSENVMLFLAGSIRRSLSGTYSYGNKLRSSKSLNIPISVICLDGNLDIKYAENLMSAIKKLVIKDVVDYAQRKSEATKQAIGSR